MKSSVKHIQNANYPDVDEAVSLWLQQACAHQIPISGNDKTEACKGEEKIKSYCFTGLQYG